MRSLLRTLSALAVAATLIIHARAEPAGAPSSAAAPGPAASATTDSADTAANDADPGSPEEEQKVQPGPNSLLLAIIAFGMRHARR